jgi:hypothetical protein
MKRRTFIKKSGAAGIIVMISPGDVARQFQQDAGLSLDQNFSIPHDQLYPQVFGSG